MYRSFTDRVLGGVCGGLGARLGVNAWWLRALFAALTLLTTGSFALIYVILWWAIPQQSLVAQRRGSFLGLIAVVALIAVAGGGWIARDATWLRGPAGRDVVWPAMLLLAGVVFFLRQLRG